MGRCFKLDKNIELYFMKCMVVTRPRGPFQMCMYIVLYWVLNMSVPPVMSECFLFDCCCCCTRRNVYQNDQTSKFAGRRNVLIPLLIIGVCNVTRKGLQNGLDQRQALEGGIMIFQEKYVSKSVRCADLCQITCRGGCVLEIIVNMKN